MFKLMNNREKHTQTDWNDLLDTLEAEAWEKDKAIIQAKAAQPADQALHEAIRQGLAQGRRVGRRRVRRRVGYGMGAALLGIFLILTAFTRVSPAFASMLSDIPILNKYVDLISSDSSLRLAAENKFLQTVGVSDERNGKKLTIPFIMTDGRRLVLFYSIEGAGVTDESRLNNTVISGVNGEELPAGYMWSSGPDDGESIAAKYDKLDIYLSEGTELPNRVKFKAESEGETFEVEFDIDHSLYQEMKEEFNVDKEFRIGGQVYRIEKMIVTPLQASVYIQGEPGNTKRMHSLRGLALEDEKGRRWTFNSGMGAIDEGGIRENFYSSYFEKPKHLTLVADGAYQNERSKKTFVIDTEKGLTLETPDERIRLTQTEPSEDGSTLNLILEIKGLGEEEGMLGYSLFDIHVPFTDGSGKQYEMEPRFGSGQSQTDDKKIDQRAEYTIPNLPYKQPLTFELNQYPGYVGEPISIPLY